MVKSRITTNRRWKVDQRDGTKVLLINIFQPEHGSSHSQVGNNWPTQRGKDDDAKLPLALIYSRDVKAAPMLGPSKPPPLVWQRYGRGTKLHDSWG